MAITVIARRALTTARPDSGDVGGVSSMELALAGTQGCAAIARHRRLFDAVAAGHLDQVLAALGDHGAARSPLTPSAPL
jgi:hypothetical protein